LGTEANTTEEVHLKDMAVATGGQYFSSPSPKNLQAVIANIFPTLVNKSESTNVDLIEFTQGYIEVHGNSFTKQPTSVVRNAEGETTIKWENISQHVGNRDSKLTHCELLF
jgi:hypothetical protein